MAKCIPSHTNLAKAFQDFLKKPSKAKIDRLISQAEAIQEGYVKQKVLENKEDDENLYRVPIAFTVTAKVIVSAKNEDEAFDAAKEANLPPKSEWEYLDNSFEVDRDGEAFEV